MHPKININDSDCACVRAWSAWVVSHKYRSIINLLLTQSSVEKNDGGSTFYNDTMRTVQSPLGTKKAIFLQYLPLYWWHCILCTRFKDFKTLLCVFISVDEGFRALRIMRECTRRHLFLPRVDCLKTTPIFITCVQIATLALHPNDVLTARGERPRPEKRVENAVVRFIRGRSSATTTQFRTQVKLTPLDCKKSKKTRNHS